MTNVMSLKPGAVVVASRNIDANGANVKVGDIGVVFLAAHPPIGDAFGPMVRWLCLDPKEQHLRPSCVCSVYEGEVREIGDYN